MDYMLGLHSTKYGNNYVFMVVDRFSKMANLASYRKNIKTKENSKLFIE